jgi:hypothetical protein
MPFRSRPDWKNSENKALNDAVWSPQSQVETPAPHHNFDRRTTTSTGVAQEKNESRAARTTRLILGQFWQA